MPQHLQFALNLKTGTALPSVFAVALGVAVFGTSLGPAWAQSFTVQSGQTVGPQTMNNPGDVGTIEPGGTISSAAGHAVTMSGDGQTLSNAGLITTTGAGNQGVLSSGANAMIANSGTITTTGDNAFGIFSNNLDVTIANSGIISTSGMNAHGILSTDTGASLTNSGIISVTGDFSLGISAQADAAVVNNTGSIITSGDTAFGIDSRGNDAVISSSGSIVTTGDNSDGINATGNRAHLSVAGSVTTTGVNAIGVVTAGDDAVIVIDGSIVTSGANSIGVVGGGANAVVVLNGSIVTTGGGAHGINSVDSNALITNCGSIHVSGAGANGIISSGANGRVTNCGRIVSEQGNAIQFTAVQDNVLTLLPGTALQGGLVLGGGNDTVIIGNGLSTALTFDKAPEVLDTTGAPFVVSGSLVAVVDPTSLSAQEELLVDLTGGIFSTLGNRLSALRQETVSSVLSYWPLPANLKTASASPAPWQLWLEGFGSLRDQRASGPATEFDSRLGGIVSGIDAPLSADTRIGFFLGGARSEVDTQFDTQQIEADSIFGGAYASAAWGETAIDAALTVGLTSYDQERLVANNLVAGGLETAAADFDGVFFSPEVTFTQPLWPGAPRFERSLTLRYAGLLLDGYTEAGTAAPLTVADRDIHVLQARAQVRMPWEELDSDGAARRAIVNIGIEGRSQFGDTDVAATLLGQNLIFSPGGDDDVAGVFGGLRLEWEMPSGILLYADVEGQLDSDDSRRLSGKTGIRVVF